MSVRRMAVTTSIVMVVFAALATSCTDRATKDNEREKENRQLREENQRIARMRDKLMSEGQGCDGEILQGDAIKNLLIGKHHQYVVPGVVSVGSSTGGFQHFSYKSNGTLYYSSAPPGFVARYTVDHNQFCHVGNLQVCFRLIKNSNGTVYTELATYKYRETASNRGIELKCIALDIKDLESDE